MISDPNDIADATKLGTKLCELCITRGQPVWLNGWLFRYVTTHGCQALIRLPNAIDPGDIPGLLPCFLKIWREPEAPLLQMEFQFPPDLRMRVHAFRRGGWEQEFLQEPMHGSVSHEASGSVN